MDHSSSSGGFVRVEVILIHVRGDVPAMLADPQFAEFIEADHPPRAAGFLGAQEAPMHGISLDSIDTCFVDTVGHIVTSI
ncbi:MAG: hypothetical protein HYR70_00515 [Chloroflexi bacterium]|nr:hypothetical protein [Chloroflexota bacterium]